MFLGMDILSDEQSLSNSKLVSNLSSFSIKNGIFDELYVSSDPNKFKKKEYDWAADTLILATFDSQTLEGGNIGALGSKIQSMQLRRREVGDVTWTTLTAYQVPDTDNLNFSFVDYFARGRNTKYEYSVNYILKDGTELPYISASVVSSFCGALITDGKTSYHVFLDPKVTSTTRNRQSSIVTTLNSRFPYVFYGSKSNYDTGNFSGTIIKNNGVDDWDFDNSYKYREDMKDWLTNGEAKIIKMEDGREWLVSVDGNVEEDESEHIDKVGISFDFVQIGDYNNTDDLSANGLTAYNDMDYATYYSITLNLESATSSSRIISVKQGESYSTKIEAYEGYVIDSVSISMNGVSITDSVYNSVNDTISIPSVTGDVIVTVTALKISVDDIAFDYNTLNLSKNSKKKINLVYSPTNAKIGAITWKSSDNATVIVDNGMVQGLKAGSATITASIDGLEAKCNVSVVSLSDETGIPLGAFHEGAAIHMRENSSPVYYIVAKHNYESELNGEGRTLLVRKPEYANTRFGSNNAYVSSEVDKLLTNTFKNSIDSKIVSVLNSYPTTIRYTPGNGKNTVSTISRTVFLLSSNEYGPSSSTHNTEGTILPTAQQLLSDGCANNKMLLTRTPAVYNVSNTKDSVIGIRYNSNDNSFEDKVIKCTDTNDANTGATVVVHPAMTLSQDIKIIIDNPIKASAVTLNKTSAIIHVGEELQLNAAYQPVDATYPLTNYGSSNPFVASVNESGLVTGKKVGTTTITVGIDNVSAACEVRVVE